MIEKLAKINIIIRNNLETILIYKGNKEKNLLFLEINIGYNTNKLFLYKEKNRFIFIN